jgi:hypothetical protein
MAADVDWSALGAGALNAAASYYGAQYGQAQAPQVAKLSGKASAWTQMLGLSTLKGFQPTLEAGNIGMLGGYQKAAGMSGMLPGVAKEGTQQALGQMQGAEQGAIQHALKQQQAQLGGVQQQGAASGFYGGSMQQGAQGQVYSQTSQSIADIMAGTAGAKAGIIQQGAAGTMQGILSAAQGQQALGDAYAKAAGAEYNLMKDKLNTVLATGNAWGVGDTQLRVIQRLSGGITAAAQSTGKGKDFAAQGGQQKWGTEGWEAHPFFSQTPTGDAWQGYSPQEQAEFMSSGTIPEGKESPYDSSQQKLFDWATMFEGYLDQLDWSTLEDLY